MVDAELLVNAYKKLDPTIKHIIKSYKKNQKLLKQMPTVCPSKNAMLPSSVDLQYAFRIRVT